MYIQWVQLANFRNYRALSYSPGPTLNILSGFNAQGKTNLLEGLCVLMVGRSFRGAKAAELPRWREAEAAVMGEIRWADVARTVRRSIGRRADGTTIVAGQSCDWARVIPFGWQDLAILHGAPRARRNFLDGFAGKLQPAHLRTHGRYRQVLGRRNRLLQSRGTRAELARKLGPWDEQLARLGVEIVRRRWAAVRALQEEVGRVYPQLGGGGSVRLEYRSALPEGVDVAGFLSAVEAARGEEARRGQTLVGPHRDDLAVEMDGQDMRIFGSRGRQRLLALALRLAETRPVAEAVGSGPVLLLDDALSELDPGVRRKVLAHLESAGQVFLTTAEEALPDARARWWEVGGGSVAETRPERVQGAA